MVAGFRFVRRVDGVVYEFVRDGDAHGFPSYRRADSEVWCRRLPEFGWSACTPDDRVTSRPFDEPGQGDLPPEGMWVSGKGDRAYVYDLVRYDSAAESQDAAE